MHNTIGQTKSDEYQYIEPAKLKYRPCFKPVFQAKIAGSLNYQSSSMQSHHKINKRQYLNVNLNIKPQR
jgi:hypothetical protein